MRRTRILLVCVLAVGVSVAASGCGAFEVLTLASAGAKLAAGDVGELTAAEWEVLTGAAADATGTPALALTPEEAAALVVFLDANNIQSFDDFENFDVTNPPQGLDELAAAFSGRYPDVDWDDPDAVNQWFEQYGDDIAAALQDQFNMS
jgi:NAD(P)-dependent dehydrogenase (short-subunit alcohol dehydrogenase family)